MLLPESYYGLTEFITNWNFYEKYVGLWVYLLKVFIELWVLIVGIILIKSNRYSKQLLWVVYFFITSLLIDFVYNLFLQKYSFFNLIEAFVLYYLFIYKDWKLSKIIKGKVKSPKM